MTAKWLYCLTTQIWSVELALPNQRKTNGWLVLFDNGDDMAQDVFLAGNLAGVTRQRLVGSVQLYECATATTQKQHYQLNKYAVK